MRVWIALGWGPKLTPTPHSIGTLATILSESGRAAVPITTGPYGTCSSCNVFPLVQQSGGMRCTGCDATPQDCRSRCKGPNGPTGLCVTCARDAYWWPERRYHFCTICAKNESECTCEPIILVFERLYGPIVSGPRARGPQRQVARTSSQAGCLALTAAIALFALSAFTVVAAIVGMFHPTIYGSPPDVSSPVGNGIGLCIIFTPIGILTGRYLYRQLWR